MVKSAVLACLTKLQNLLYKSTLPGIYPVFGCGYNLTGVKLKASFVCDYHAFAEVNLRGLFSVFYICKRMVDLITKIFCELILGEP